MKAAKASGANIPEGQRGTVAVKLRLPPDVADDLDDQAALWRLTRSGAVARLLEMVTDSDACGCLYRSECSVHGTGRKLAVTTRSGRTTRGNGKADV